MMGAGFEPDSLDRGYAFVATCPPKLLGAVLALPYDNLQERVAGVRAWYDALLAGSLPSADTWPRAPRDVPARRALESMRIVRFCKAQPELVDDLMADIVDAFGRSGAAFALAVAAKLQALETEERARLLEIETSRAREAKRLAQMPALDTPRLHWPLGLAGASRAGAAGTAETAGATHALDPATLQRLRAEAQRQVAGLNLKADASLLEGWQHHAAAWAEVAEVFGDLHTLLGRGWDMSLGVLKQTGWRDLLRLRALVETLPQLREIIQSLGRLQAGQDDESVAEMIFTPMTRLEEELREITTPLIPAETRGIERSGDIARMLPVEAALLAHPALRMLWHARRAERALLSYRYEGKDTEVTLVEREYLVGSEGKKPRPERGPIIAIVDTSGSMAGLPERVAKAIVLEAARAAHAEKRRCFVYAFSGPGQLIEQELDLTPEGLGRLLAFLGFSFGGGTDETGVLRQVLQKLKECDWRRADVLFVSDGGFGAPPELVASVASARADGTRFHGVQVGRPGTTSLHAFCDPVHVFADWARAGGWF